MEQTRRGLVENRDIKVFTVFRYFTKRPASGIQPNETQIRSKQKSNDKP